MDFEQTFKSNRTTLLNLATAHSLKCGGMIPTEDFYSQGCEIFIQCFNKYDPAKAQFSTYFIGCCKGFFKGMIVKETLRSLNHISTRQIASMEYSYDIKTIGEKQYRPNWMSGNEDNLKNTINPERRVSFMDAMKKLSADAVEVIALVLKTPADFIDDVSKSTIRKFFIKSWGGHGGQERVRVAFNEIRQTLDDF